MLLAVAFLMEVASGIGTTASEGSYVLRLDLSEWSSEPTVKVVPRPLQVLREDESLLLTLRCSRSYSLSLDANGNNAAFDVSKHEECRDLDLVATPRQTSLARGAVRNQFHQPVAGAAIAVEEAMLGVSFSGIQEVFPSLVGQPVTSNDDGSLFLPVTDALYPLSLHVSAAQHRTDVVDVADPRTLTTLVLESTRGLSGEIQLMGTDLPAETYVRCEYPSDPPRRGCGYAEAEPDGTFYMASVPTGELHLSLTNYSSDWSRTSGTNVDGAASFVVIEANIGYSLRGVVSDDVSLAGVADVEIMVLAPDLSRPISSATTNAEGRFEALMIDSEDVVLLIQDSRYFEERIRVELERQTPEELEIALSPVEYSDVVVRVLENEGSPLEGLEVSAHNLANSRFYTERTDSSGRARFRIRATPRLRVSLAAKGGFSSQRIVDVSIAEEYEVTLYAVLASTLSGTLSPGGCPAGPVVWLRSGSRNRRALVDGNRFLFRDLEPGEAHVVVSCESQEVLSVPVSVHAGESQDLGLLAY